MIFRYKKLSAAKDLSTKSDVELQAVLGAGAISSSSSAVDDCHNKRKRLKVTLVGSEPDDGGETSVDKACKSGNQKAIQSTEAKEDVYQDHEEIIVSDGKMRTNSKKKKKCRDLVDCDKVS